MARTIVEIKKEMTDAFVANDTIKALYELEPPKEFEDQFSKVSLESILFHVVATCVWTLEKLFDRHRQEVKDLIDELKPHSLLWYVNKAKAFQYDRSLIPNTDRYDNSGLSDEVIRLQQVVKYAAVEEKSAIVSVKVATGNEGARKQLTPEQKKALETYFKKVKDAGVKLEVVNEPAEEFNVEMEVYYDPMVFDNTLSRSGGARTVHDAIAAFVENLPFNGEYRNSALIARLLELEGVVLVELKQATANGKPINAKEVPRSGYYWVDKNKLKITPKAYETVSN